MSRGRIAYATEEPLLLTFDRELLLAFDATTLAPKWTLSFDVPLAAIVFASSAALPPVHGGHPWRSASSGSDALAIDQAGGIHALDVAAGRVLGALAPVGAPVAVAASAVGDGFAVALADRLLLWHDTQRYELALAATALAFSRDGLTLAAGSAKGEVREITVATRAIGEARLAKGAVNAIAARRAGEWVVATSAGVHHVTRSAVRRLREGGATEIACDARGEVIALQLAADRVLVCEWPASPVTRIEMAGRTISDLVLRRDRLALAVHGGDANVVALGPRTHRATTEHPGRKSRPWTLEVEAEKDVVSRWEGAANRLGLGVFMTLVVVLLCMGYLSSSAKQTWVPPPAFVVSESCDDTCELRRVEVLRAACQEESAVDCGSDAEEAEAALEIRACDEARLALGRVRHRLGARDDGGHAQLGAKLLAAEQGLERGCLPAPADRKRMAIVQLTGDELTPAVDTSPFAGLDPRAIVADESGAVFLATVAGGRAMIRQKVPGEGWHTRRVQEGAHSAALAPRPGGGLYASLASAVWFADESGHWRDLSFPGQEVEALRATREALFVTDRAGALYELRQDRWSRDVLPEGVLAGSLATTSTEAFALGATTKGAVLLRQAPGWAWQASPGPTARGELWAAPDGTLFAASWSSVAEWPGDEMKSATVPAVVDRIWGRSSRDVYAGGPSGLVHYDGETWTTTSFRTRVRGISGTSRSVWLITDKP